MAADQPPGAAMSITVAALVGRNVRLARESRAWDRERLADEAAVFDVEWDAEDVDLIEQGERDVTVGDLVILGVLLGIAPHLLLYPEQGAVVTLGAVPPESENQSGGLEDIVLRAETHLSAAELSDWIWSPDDHASTHVDVRERDLWLGVTALQDD